MDTWSHCFSFLGVRDHVALMQCNKSFRTISKNPHSATHEWVHTEKIKNISRLVNFRPKYLEHSYDNITDLSPLTTVESLITTSILYDSITSLTKLTRIEFDIFRPLDNSDLDLLPTSIVSLKCNYELDVELSRFTNLRILHVNAIWTDIFHLPLQELRVEDFDHKMQLPALRKLILATEFNINWMDDFKSTIPLHLIVNITTNNINIFKRYTSPPGTTMELTLLDVFYLPEAKITSLRAYCKIDDIKSIATLSSLDTLTISWCPRHIIASIMCNKSQFHYWPNLKTIRLSCDIKTIKEVMQLIHDSEHPANNHPIFTVSRSPYVIQVDKKNIRAIRDLNISSFDVVEYDKFEYF